VTKFKTDIKKINLRRDFVGFWADFFHLGLAEVKLGADLLAIKTGFLKSFFKHFKNKLERLTFDSISTFNVSEQGGSLHYGSQAQVIWVWHFVCTIF
jgi:hypothetical protein